MHHQGNAPQVAAQLFLAQIGRAQVDEAEVERLLENGHGQGGFHRRDDVNHHGLLADNQVSGEQLASSNPGAFKQR